MKQHTQRLAIGAILVLIVITLGWLASPSVHTNIGYSKLYLANDGSLLRLQLTADEQYRVYTPLAHIPTLLQHATVVYEDDNFYRHNGVNLSAIVRAVWQTYIARERKIGASTITMQLAKQLWDIPSYTVGGKLAQIGRAWQLERHLSKDEILTLYFNLAPYGYNIEGVGAAAWIYFNKPVHQLTELELLSLVVIPQNPTKRRLADSARQPHNQAARGLLLQRLHAANITIRPATERNIQLPLAASAPKQLPFNSPHVINALAQQHPAAHTINTTINPSIQGQVERIAKRYIDTHRHRGLVNTSVMVVNHQSLEVEALLGSVDFHNAAIFGQVDGSRAKRSPGSTLKPFVYGLAIDQGLIHPNSILNDQAKRFGGFTPENFDKQFLGPLTATQALVTSRNLPAVTLQGQLKGKDLYSLLQQAHVQLPEDRAHYGLALGLGGAELTMMELAGLYTALANGGTWQALKTQQQDQATLPSEQLLSPEAAWLSLWMLAQNPPAWQASDFNNSHANDIAWKTGTSWAFRDAWAIGISKQHVILVWVGNFDGSGNPAFVGASAAGPLLFQLFDALHQQNDWHIQQLKTGPLETIRRVKLCKKTGELYTPYCPQATEGYFIAGVSPIKTNTVFKPIPVNKTTGLRSCWYKPDKDELKVFEFWPSDYEQAFRRAGVSTNTAPAFEASCHFNQRQQLRDDQLKIESPYNGTHYILQPNKNRPQTVVFEATTGADATTTHWFLNGNFVASTPKQQRYHWPLQTGQFVLEAVDDLGSVDSVAFSVDLP